jgi:hypothetical protein
MSYRTKQRNKEEFIKFWHDHVMELAMTMHQCGGNPLTSPRFQQVRPMRPGRSMRLWAASMRRLHGSRWLRRTRCSLAVLVAACTWVRRLTIYA